jgi:chaperonin GroEL (HSP60 family)
VFNLHQLPFLRLCGPQAEKLLDRGLHPVRIAEGYDRACTIAVKALEAISDEVRP